MDRRSSMAATIGSYSLEVINLKSDLCIQWKVDHGMI